jgi:endonuclease IV
MKIGVKSYDSYEFFKHFEDKADFFEVQAIESVNYDFLKNLSKPFVVHSQHWGQGVNNADKTLYKRNIKSFRFAQKVADLCGADKIILHPGRFVNGRGSVEDAISFIKKLDDRRVLLENLPLQRDIYWKNAFATTPEEMKRFLEETGMGFCFDFNHAVETAFDMNKDYMRMIRDFLKLNPSHFHAGGQRIKEFKTHLSLSDSDFDVKKIIQILPKNADITLETTTDIKRVEEDIELIRKWI